MKETKSVNGITVKNMDKMIEEYKNFLNTPEVEVIEIDLSETKWFKRLNPESRSQIEDEYRLRIGAFPHLKDGEEIEKVVMGVYSEEGVESAVVFMDKSGITKQVDNLITLKTKRYNDLNKEPIKSIKILEEMIDLERFFSAIGLTIETKTK